MHLSWRCPWHRWTRYPDKKCPTASSSSPPNRWRKSPRALLDRVALLSSYRWVCGCRRWALKDIWHVLTVGNTKAISKGSWYSTPVRTGQFYCFCKPISSARIAAASCSKTSFAFLRAVSRAMSALRLRSSDCMPSSLPRSTPSSIFCRALRRLA